MIKNGCLSHHNGVGSSINDAHVPLYLEVEAIQPDVGGDCDEECRMWSFIFVIRIVKKCSSLKQIGN